MVGLTGFEPATTCTPCRCATRLRHSPMSFEGEGLHRECVALRQAIFCEPYICRHLPNVYGVLRPSELSVRAVPNVCRESVMTALRRARAYRRVQTRPRGKDRRYRRVRRA